MNQDLHVWDALVCAHSFSQLRVMRVTKWRLWTNCTRALEGEGQPEELDGREVGGGGVHSLGLCKLGRRYLGTWIAMGARKLVRD
jgi:hypothetical protein